MEVKIDKRYPIQASVEQAWVVLSDVRATAGCMPGAQITEQLDETHFKGTVKSKVGPATMSFGGDIELLGLDAASKTLKMLGKGADRAGSSAMMNLEAQLVPGEGSRDCVLVGAATIQVNGKLAQFGSRLLVPVADAMLGQFANNFNAIAATVEVPSAAGGTGAPAAASTSAASAAEPPAQESSATAQSMAAAPAVSAVNKSAIPAPAVKELNALGLLWIVIKGWFSGLFGKKT